MIARKKIKRTLSARLHSLLCVLMAAVLAVSIVPVAPARAYAADAVKPEQVIMQMTNQQKQIDVVKNVATLDVRMNKDTAITFNVSDKYTGLSNDRRLRYLVIVKTNGYEKRVSESSTNTIGLRVADMEVGAKLKLVTMTKEGNDTDLVKRYEQELNVRFIDSSSAEQKPNSANSGGIAGISDDGGSWSFSNGFEYTFKNTGFSFLDGTSMNLGALRLPLKYVHNPDGTTIVGINCNPEDQAFYNAIKNGNVWQKYTTDALAKMTGEMDKGWSGKKFGTWGGKAFDWNVCGYMEFNTKEPNAPRALNLILSTGVKAEGHAQYLCFTGTVTFTVGGKATVTGKLSSGNPAFTGKGGLGAYAGLELYVGLGLQYVASVGAFGKGQINIDFQVVPDFFLDSIKLSGTLGAKAKVFGFTVYTWNILNREVSIYSRSANNVLKAAEEENEDGTATSPFTVDADTVYPMDSRDYLEDDDLLTDELGEELEAQATMDGTTIRSGIYGETELVCATTNDGPVVAYIADAAQVGDETRDAANRSVLVYSRYKNGAWTDPTIIDSTDKNADFSPSISTDGENCFISWLAADSAISSETTIGQVGQKLDVNVATVTKDDSITVETVSEESSENGTMPASPQATRVGDKLYVGWYTDQTSGSEGEVIGVSGSHSIRMYQKNFADVGGTAAWQKTSEVTGQSGAITSFDVGSYGGTAACAWSLDEQFTYAANELSLNGANTLASSSVYYMTPDSTEAQLLAQGATNAQFAKNSDADVLTYAIRNANVDTDSASYLSIQSSPEPGAGDTVVLDGSQVNLPTSYYTITGDLGKGRAGNISFLKAGDGTCDIQALVTTGSGASDWTSVVEATPDTATVTDYCATYVNGQPLFIYTTQGSVVPTDAELTGQAEDNGSVDMSQTTDTSLQHLSVTDVDYDEYAVDSGQSMPVTVNFENDGLLDTKGVDLWLLDGDTVTKVASSDVPVAIDEEGTISFDYTVPSASEFSDECEFTVYATPAGVTPTRAKILREVANESAMTVSLGAASLSLEVDHQIVDGQESIVSTVTNDGIASHGAQLVYIDSDTDEVLTTMDVPELGENETFTASYDAENGYFQNSGIKSVIITLENDGTEAEGYEINNTEFVSTWELSSSEEPTVSDTSEQATETTTTVVTTTTTKRALPATGDQDSLALALALIALASISGSLVIRTSRKSRE